MPFQHLLAHYRAVRTTVETREPLGGDEREIGPTIILAPLD